MKKVYFGISALLLPFCVVSQSISTDSTVTISEVIIAENRLQIPFSKQNRNVQIIEKAAIQKLPVKSINEVLTFVAGVDVRQRGPFGTQADVSIDGGSFDQTLILINGVKVSDVQTGHHSMNIPVSLDAVERIEILKGPAARVYGINALTGAINIVTTTTANSDASVHIQAGTSFEDKAPNDGSGIYGGGTVQAVANLSNEGFQNLISLSYGKTNGQRYNSATADQKIFYQGKIKAGNNTAVDVMAGYIHNEFGANGYYAAPGDIESYEVVNTFFSSLGATHSLSEKFILKPRLTYRLNKDDYRYFRHDLNTARSQHRTDAISAELNSVWKSDIGDFGFGWESRSEKIESNNIGNRERYNHGLYAEYRNDMIQNLFLNIGTYVNYNTQYGWQVFPGLDAAYLFADNWKVTFNVGSSQRLPTYTDLYLNQAKNIGNPDLKSENAWQFEGALRYNSKKSYVQAGYFRREISEFIDWIRYDENAAYQPHNFGENKVQGLNFSAGQYININDQSLLKYDVSYNYLKPQTQSYPNAVTSKYVVESLKHQALLRLVYQYHNWSVTSANRWIERELNDPYFISDVKFGYDQHNWNFYVDISNIFNEDYKEVAATPLPKRWFSLGFRYKLNNI